MQRRRGAGGEVPRGAGGVPTHPLPVSLRLFEERVVLSARLDEGGMGLAALSLGREAIRGQGSLGHFGSFALRPPIFLIFEIKGRCKWSLEPAFCKWHNSK